MLKVLHNLITHDLIINGSLIWYMNEKIEWELDSPILVAGRFDTYTSLKEIQYQLSSIAKQFLKLYPKKVIIENGHKTSMFSSFGKHIKTKRDLLGDKIDSLWRVKFEYLECY